MKRYVCVHGHFYQPPRENPWLEAIERQDSAYPYHDWNARITAECYQPNGRSRILDGEGWITRIVNNYARMSFNFGPTVLSWMQRHAPEAYAGILEADRVSAGRYNGHGNAIAQAYNHMIMPLSCARDRKTQVVWGVRDFKRRFGRDPEGMWLPETAVNTETLEALADEGIRFTILAPRQALAHRPLGEEKWTSCEDEGIDPSRPYVKRLPSGREIALFFYDGPISQGVAFEGLLESGERFSGRLLDAFDKEREGAQLAHIATDGESYGHHHRHGDMALAFAMERIEREGLATITNYAAFLDEHPPEHEAEIVENSSWSCVHGIERWRTDCGCNSGGRPGWNQRWRKPLREALDWLRDELAPEYERAAGRLLKDPWAARDAYVDVILDRGEQSVGRFFEAHAQRALEPAERIKAMELLEMQRHAMLMYTSCGWFFDDLSGIETVQVIQYAGRVIQLARDTLGVDLETGFLERLERARSNLEKQGDGRRVYESHVKPAFVDLPKVAAHLGIASLFHENGREEVDVYCYRARVEVDRDDRAGAARLRAGRATLESRITGEVGEVRFAVVHLGGHVVSGGVTTDLSPERYDAFLASAHEAFRRARFVDVLRGLDDYFGESTYTLATLFRDEQRFVVSNLLESTLASVRASYRHIYEDNAALLRFHSNLNIPAPRELTTAAEFVVNEEVREAIAALPEDAERVERLLDEAEADGVRLDDVTLAFEAEEALNRVAEAMREQPAALERVEALLGTLRALAQFRFEIDREAAQNIFYELMHTTRPAVAASAGGDRTAARWVEAFDEVGRLLSVRVQG